MWLQNLVTPFSCFYSCVRGGGSTACRCVMWFWSYAYGKHQTVALFSVLVAVSMEMLKTRVLSHDFVAILVKKASKSIFFGELLLPCTCEKLAFHPLWLCQSSKCLMDGLCDMFSYSHASKSCHLRLAVLWGAPRPGDVEIFVNA